MISDAVSFRPGRRAGQKCRRHQADQNWNSSNITHLIVSRLLYNLVRIVQCKGSVVEDRFKFAVWIFVRTQLFRIMLPNCLFGVPASLLST